MSYFLNQLGNKKMNEESKKLFKKASKKFEKVGLYYGSRACVIWYG